LQLLVVIRLRPASPLLEEGVPQPGTPRVERHADVQISTGDSERLSAFSISVNASCKTGILDPWGTPLASWPGIP